MRHKYLAFVPIFNTTYILGNISDSININYFKRSYFRFSLLISYLTSIISGVLILIIISSHIPDFQKFFVDSLIYQSKSFEILKSIFDLNPPYVGLLILLLFLAFLAASIFNFVFSFWCFSIIYTEYGKRKSNSYMLMAIICGAIFNIKFLRPLIVYMIRKNTPTFEFLNKIKTSDLNK